MDSLYTDFTNRSCSNTIKIDMENTIFVGSVKWSNKQQKVSYWSFRKASCDGAPSYCFYFFSDCVTQGFHCGLHWLGRRLSFDENVCLMHEEILSIGSPIFRTSAISLFPLEDFLNPMINAINHTICPHVITENIPFGFIDWPATGNQLWCIGVSRIAAEKDFHCTNLTRPFNHEREPIPRSTDCSGRISKNN